MEGIVIELGKRAWADCRATCLAVKLVGYADDA